MGNNALDWLLQDDNPAIKYRTMVEICGADREECRDVYNLILKQKPVVKMFSKQDGDGLWSDSEYGCHTSFRYLTSFAEFGIYNESRLWNYVDVQIKFMDYVINKEYKLNEHDIFGCVVPLVLRAFVMLGYHENADVKRLVEQFAQTQVYDGGFLCKRLYNQRPERKSCYIAAIAGLLLYAECKRKGILPGNAEKLVDYFINRGVFYSSDKTGTFKEGKPGWRFIDNFFPLDNTRMGLPMIVSALSILGAGNHSAMDEAWELLRAKEDEDGKLKLEGTFSKHPCNFGKVGQANKWVTFYTLLAKKYRCKV